MRGAAGLTASVLLAAATATAQPVVGGPDMTLMRLGASDLNRYEALYGEPEFRTLDAPLDGPGDWPVRRSIRTEGEIFEFATQDEQGDRRHGYGIRGRAHSLTPRPVTELLDVWGAHVPFWVRQRVEVVGVFDPDIAPGQLLVWQISLIPERDVEAGAPRVSLEDLVIDPKGHAGQKVTAVGTFRGANLFDDMEDDSRRDPADWVLRNGPFFIWVTGRPPKGRTFSLDPADPADCRQRLEVVGQVETENGYIYLRAEQVRLLGRARDDPPDPE